MIANRLGAGSGPALVLVVDDSHDMRTLIADVLRAEGHEVVLAASGDRALSLMAERRPDLVITDLLMPGMNGFTLRGEMLRSPELADVPVVVLSAFWQRPSETLEVVDVIAKPLDLDRLLTVVRHALGGADGADGAAAPRRGRSERRRDAGRVKQEA
jgi:CheY-like chemotaxis protein